MFEILVIIINLSFYSILNLFLERNNYIAEFLLMNLRKRFSFDLKYQDIQEIDYLDPFERLINR